MEVASNIELGTDNFNQYNFFEKYDVNLYKAILENLKTKIETRDEAIMRSNWRKNKGYIVKDILPRTIITKYGAVNYKRRRYRYWDEKQGKHCYTYLVDREFQVESFERITLHLKIKILEEIASGSRQHDILKLYEKSSISKMSISNVIRQFDFPNLYELESFPYKKVEIKNNLYIWVDDTFVKLRNKFKKATKYRFRLVTFHTGYEKNNGYKNSRNVLANKRVFCVIKSEKERIYTSSFVQKIKKMAHKFYNNVSNAKIIIGGDGARWITETGKELGAEYVLDLFHGTRKLHLDLKKKQNDLYEGIFRQASNFLRNGEYNELITFLKNCDTFMWKNEQKNKLKSLIKYFRAKKEGVINQGASWNIGVNAEGQISHIIKWLLSYGGKIFNIRTFKNMLHVHIANINGINPVDLLRKEIEDERIEEIKRLKQNNWKYSKPILEYHLQAGKLYNSPSAQKKHLHWLQENLYDYYN